MASGLRRRTSGEAAKAPQKFAAIKAKDRTGIGAVILILIVLCG